jgi:hypothetical protein
MNGCTAAGRVVDPASRRVLLRIARPGLSPLGAGTLVEGTEQLLVSFRVDQRVEPGRRLGENASSDFATI